MIAASSVMTHFGIKVPKKASSVKTGDPFRYLGAFLLILTGGVLLTGVVLKRKR